MEAGHVFLRLEALDHRKARQGVLEGAGVGLLFVGDHLLRPGRPIAQDDGHGDGQQGEADGDDGQKGIEPQHESQGADEGEGGLDHALQGVYEVPFDGVHVVRKGGDVEGGVLPGEGLDALLEEPVKGVSPVLLHGP